MSLYQNNQQDLFPKRFLLVLLFISIFTNIYLLAKFQYPNIIHTIQVALLPAPKVLPTDHVRGRTDAKYTVIAYTDFQCPFCSQLHGAMTEIMQEADVRWVYRHFPLPGHKFAAKAAEASECAGEQGKFWEYSDALFALKGQMTGSSFMQIAQDLGLDWVAFGMCLGTGKNTSAVAAQYDDGIKNKITGTPTFYVNNKRFDGFVPLEDLRKLVGVKAGK